MQGIRRGGGTKQLLGFLPTPEEVEVEGEGDLLEFLLIGDLLARPEEESEELLIGVVLFDSLLMNEAGGVGV